MTSTTMSIHLLGLTIVVAMVTPAPVDAQGTTGDDSARRFFQSGKASFDAGDFEQALKAFEQAFEISHRPELQYNIGLAADRLRQDERALAAFRGYLEQIPDAENRVEVEGRIRALEKVKAERGPTVMPSPEEVARGTGPGANDPDRAPTKGQHHVDVGAGKPVTKKWWFWTSIGVAVVTGVIVGVAAASGGDAATAEAFDSRSGIAVMALTGR